MENNVLELIAIHIEKTAGQSFKRALKKVYGNKSYFRFNFNKKFRNQYANADLRNLIPENTRVLQGHFNYSEVSALHKDTGARMVVWLREPVERVISNYYFNKRKALEGKRQNNPGLEHMTLLEFAERRSKRKSMSHILEGIELKDIFFVGITEHYSEDLAGLASLLGWGSCEEEHRNVNAAFKSKFDLPTEDERREIRRLFSKDIELYNEALEMRSERLKVGKNVN